MANFLPIKYVPQGGMSSDDDPRFRHGGMYGIDSKNIQFLTQGGVTTPSIEPTLGNVYGYTLPSVVAQNKVFRIYIDVTLASPPTNGISLSSPNGVVEFFAQWFIVLGDALGTYNAAILSINTAAGVQGQTVTTSAFTATSASTGYFDFSLTTVLYWDYQMNASSGNAQPPIVIQESIDASIVGPLQQIGSYDLEGDLFLWSTPQHELPSTLPIVSVSNNGFGIYNVNVINHGLLTGYRVVINGVTQLATGSQHNSNGQWIITLVDANNFTLQGSNATMFANPNTGNIVLNSQGVGEVGVAQRNDDTKTWTYTTLLRSKEFNFRTKKQIKCTCERSDIRASLYWTDNYNSGRRLLYYGSYQSNGALNYIDSENTYFYGTIGSATKLIPGVNFFHVTLDGIIGGGGVPDGNHRAAIRLLTDDLSPTLLSDVTPLVNIYSASLTPPQNIFGDNAGDISGKTIQYLITGIVPNLFKYVELIDIYYAGGTPVATIVRRDLLTQQTTQIIQNTGLETNTQVFDLAQFSEVDPGIETFLNIDAIANRLFISNITTNVNIDLTAFGLTPSYSLIREPLTGIQSRYNNTLVAGEYQIPSNLFFFAGYMLNETYRFSLKPKMKNGFIAPNIFLFDVKFDTNPTSPDGRRLAGLPSYDLTDSTGTVVYSFGIQISGIDWNFLIDGVPIKDLVEEFEVERVEMTDAFKEIVASGVMVLSQETVLGAAVEVIDTSANTYPRTFVWGNSITTTPILTDLSDFHSVAGQRLDNPTGTPVVLNPAYIGGVDTYRTGSIYSPDLMFGFNDWQYSGSDQIINYGNPEFILFGGASAAQIGQTPLNSNEFYNNLREYTGSFLGFNITNHNVLEKIDIGYNGSGALATLGRNYNKSTFFSTNFPGLPESGFMSTPESPVIVCQTGLSFNGGIADFGLRNISVYRQKLNKFGVIEQSKYIPTGTSFNSSITSVNVYGGDVMTQKTWLRHTTSQSYDSSPGGSHWANAGLGQGIAFYSQNRVNSQMINREDSSNFWKYPFINEQAWLNETQGTSSPSAPTLVYNHGYDIIQGITEDAAYDPNLKTSEKQPARFRYSALKPENSVADQYTVFLPLNFKDLQLSFGEITHHMNVNSQLLSWQPYHFEIQYVNSTGLLATNAQDVVLGDGGVMAQRGTALSTYGTSHGFSVIKGKTAGGKDAVAWIDTVHGKIVKHDPSQGTTVISDVQQMRWFANNYTRYAGLYDTPADGMGIHGVFDYQNNEFIWTVRAWKNEPEWGASININNVQFITSTRTLITTNGSHGFNNGDSIRISGVTGFTSNPNGVFIATLAGGNQVEINFNVVSGTYVGGGTLSRGAYFQGDVVSYQSTNFHQIPTFYRSLINNNTFIPTNATYWEEIQLTDYEYYNVFTLAYNEVKNKFTTFYSYLPKIYSTRGKLFLSPSPVNDQRQAYEHLRGDYCTWYTQGNLELTDRWRIGGMAINYDINLSKHFLNLMFQSKLAPTRIEVKTSEYSTYMQDIDCEKRFDQWVVSIKNNLDAQGRPDQDTSFLLDTWASVSIEGEPKVYTNFFDFIMRARYISRTYQT